MSDLSFDPEPLEPRPRSFFADGTIETLDEASWAARKLRKYRQTLAEVERLYDVERERLDRWIEAERARIGADAERFHLALTSWHRRRLMEDGNAKTIRLPAATLKARQLPDRVKVSEPEVFLEWAEENMHRDMIRVKKAPAITPLGEYIRSTGEVPPGVEMVPGELSLNVITDDAEDA